MNINMNANKQLTIEDFKNLNLDEILNRYRDGWSLAAAPTCPTAIQQGKRADISMTLDPTTLGTSPYVYEWQADNITKVRYPTTGTVTDTSITIPGYIFNEDLGLGGIPKKHTYTMQVTDSCSPTPNIFATSCDITIQSEAVTQPSKSILPILIIGSVGIIGIAYMMTKSGYTTKRGTTKRG